MNLQPFARFFELFFACLILSSIAGCAATTPSTQPPPAQATTGRQLPFSLAVKTAGLGVSGDIEGRTDVNVKKELEDALARANLFKQIVREGSGEYDLTVAVTGIQRPPPVFSTTVGIEATWTLVRASDKAVVLRKVITSAHTVPMSEMPLFVRRAQMAADGAVRKNISEGLQAISDAKI